MAAQAATEPDTEPETILEEETEVSETAPVVEAAAVTPTAPIYAMAAKPLPPLPSPPPRLLRRRSPLPRRRPRRPK